MKSLSKNQELCKNSSLTEFDDIVQLSSVDQITIGDLKRTAKLMTVCEGQKMKDLLEQKVMQALEPYVMAILKENNVDSNLQQQNIEQINSIVQKITSSMSAQTTCYFRAGKTYLKITHEMGDIGNLFFKSLFYNILKNIGEYHIQMQKNTICAIYRI